MRNTLVGPFSQEAARLRSDSEQLWKDLFIEQCNDWAVPYIGDLLGARVVSELDLPAGRVKIAKMIYSRLEGY